MGCGLPANNVVGAGASAVTAVIVAAIPPVGAEPPAARVSAGDPAEAKLTGVRRACSAQPCGPRCPPGGGPEWGPRRGTTQKHVLSRFFVNTSLINPFVDSSNVGFDHLKL